jgi:ribosomal protein S18 acetylase RimI-like enzyme
VIIEPAAPADLAEILDMRAETANWLGALGTDQWARPFPDEQSQSDRLLAGITAGETWMVRDGSITIGTITINGFSNPLLWTEAECAESARYVHKMNVRRSHAGVGLGGRLLDWAGNRAAKEGAKWLRLDAWTTNEALQNYYRRQGFQHVRTVVRPDYPSGAIFQRPATIVSDFSPLDEVGASAVAHPPTP